MKAILVCLALVFSIPVSAEIVTLLPVKDAFVCDCMPDETNPTLGEDLLAQGQYGVCFNRLFIQFDLSELEPDETINSAEFKIYCLQFYGTPHGEMLYTALIEDWDENTVTFNNQPGYNEDYQVVSPEWPEAGAWFYVDVTDIAVAWYEGTIDNYGFIGHSRNTTSMCDPSFPSSNYPGTPPDPKLIIDYTGSASDIEAESIGMIKATLK